MFHIFGDGDSCIIATEQDGVAQVFAWGRNLEGQLGVNIGDQRWIPGTELMEIPEFNGLRVKDVVSGVDFTALLTVQGNLYMWGDNRYHQISTQSKRYISKPTIFCQDVEQVKCGAYHTVFLKKNRKLKFFGCIDHWVVCAGTDKKRKNVPLEPEENVLQFECGTFNFLILIQDGRHFGKRRLYFIGSPPGPFVVSDDNELEFFKKRQEIIFPTEICIKSVAYTYDFFHILTSKS